MKRVFAALLLISTTFFWGITFTFVKGTVARVGMFVFQSQRFILAALLMIIPGLLFRNKPDRPTVIAGMKLGAALFSAYAFQTAALLYTSASNTAFLTGLNVVFVPLIAAAIMRQRVSAAVCWQSKPAKKLVLPQTAAKMSYRTPRLPIKRSKYSTCPPG